MKRTSLAAKLTTRKPRRGMQGQVSVVRFNRLTRLCSPSTSVKCLSPIGTICQTRLSEYLKWQAARAFETMVIDERLLAPRNLGLQEDHQFAGSALRCEGFQDQRLHSQDLRASFRLDSSRRHRLRK